jgi:hypothetical protein
MDFLPGSTDQTNDDGGHLASDERPLVHELRKSESRVRFNDDIKVTIIEDSPSEADTELEESSNIKKQDTNGNTETVVDTGIIENMTATFDKNEAKYGKSEATLGDKIQLENKYIDNKGSPATSGEEGCDNMATGNVPLMVTGDDWAIRLDCGNSTEAAEAIPDSKTEDGLSLEETEAGHKDFNEGMRGPGVKGEVEKQDAAIDDRMTAEKAKEEEADADEFDVDIENSFEKEEESPKVGELSQASHIFRTNEIYGLNLADATHVGSVEFRDDHIVDHVENDMDDHVSPLVPEILNGDMVDQTADRSADQDGGHLIVHVDDHGDDHVKDQVANHAVDHPADDVAFQGNAGLGDHLGEDHVPDHKRRHEADHELAGHVVQELAGHVVQELAGHVVQELAGHVVQEQAGHVVQELGGHVVQELAGHVVQELGGEDELVDVETIGNPEENFDFLILKVQ